MDGVRVQEIYTARKQGCCFTLKRSGFMLSPNKDQIVGNATLLWKRIKDTKLHCRQGLIQLFTSGGLDPKNLNFDSGTSFEGSPQTPRHKFLVSFTANIDKRK